MVDAYSFSYFYFFFKECGKKIQLTGNTTFLHLCFILTDSTLPPIGPLEVRTILLQEDGVPTASSFARLNTSFPELFSFTVCYRIYLLRFREESTLMSYAVSENKDNELRMGEGKWSHDLSPSLLDTHNLTN